MPSIFIASLYVGGGSSIQYLGRESIPSSRAIVSFFLSLQIQKFIIVQWVIITKITKTNKNVKDKWVFC